MGLHDTRLEIALALRTVEGVTGYQYRPKPPKAGDSWPLLGGLKSDDGYNFEVTWRVMVYLPQDETGASDWIDEKYYDLVEALRPIAITDSVDVVNLGTEVNPIYGLQITMRGE